MKNDEILSLLQKHIDTEIETIAVRNMVRLDFREVYIGSLVTLVKKTFEAGRDKGYDEGIEAAQEMNSVYDEAYCGK